MKTHQNAKFERNAKKRPPVPITPRQQRQHPAVSAVTLSKLNAREFKRLKTMVLWLQERKSYRWLEKYTGRGHGWWQQVGAGHRNRVAPNHGDLVNIQHIYEIMQADQSIDTEALNLLLDVMEAKGRMEVALTKLINMSRKRIGKSADDDSPQR